MNDVDQDALDELDALVDETPTEQPIAAVEDSLRGRRFAAKHAERAHLHRLHPMRLWRLVVGIALLIFGIINIFIPGPGGSVIILASLLILAGESKLLARMFDWFEVKFARQVDWALSHKIAAMLIVSGCAFIAVSLLGYTYTKLR